MHPFDLGGSFIIAGTWLNVQDWTAPENGKAELGGNGEFYGDRRQEVRQRSNIGLHARDVLVNHYLYYKVVVSVHMDIDRFFFWRFASFMPFL